MKGILSLAGLLLMVILAALLAPASREIAAQQTPSSQIVTIPVSGMT